VGHPKAAPVSRGSISTCQRRAFNELRIRVPEAKARITGRIIAYDIGDEPVYELLLGYRHTECP
jgi:hypothetical protein